MEKNSYRNFYRQFYRKTGGFIPCRPLHQHVYPGDFFQVRGGEMMILGNIFHKGIVDIGDVSFARNKKLYPSAWDISDGISKPYSGRSAGNGVLQGEFEFSKQVVAFARRGSFFFRGQHPQSSGITNWGNIKEQLIIKLTQVMYSFRQVYVVTETASAEGCTLAIAGADNAELEVASTEENFGLIDIYGLDGTKTIQSRDLEYYHREHKRKPVFFKAKKLAVRDETAQVFISDLLGERQGLDNWAGSFFDYQYDEEVIPAVTGYSPCVLDLLQANQLNPNTALEYFSWQDAGLDDIDHFFTGYANS